VNYYNENDSKAVAWLRELIAQGHIADGIVDERSIEDVSPNDLRGFRQCHFFAGIGGWSLALRLAGVSDDEEIWTGSCPCQPFSNAGEGLAEKDPRHLWPVWYGRLITECQPPIVFGEQVASALGRLWLAGVRLDLEALGYEVGAADLCAAGIGAPHIRQRLWWVADALSHGWHTGHTGESASAHAAHAGFTGADCGMAHAALKQINTSDERGFLTESGGDCATRGMAHASGVSGTEHGVESRGGQGAGPHHTSEHGGIAGRLGHTSGDDERRASLTGLHGQGQSLGRSSGHGDASEGLGHTNGSRCEQYGGPESVRAEQSSVERAGSLGGAWDGFDLIACADGKTRRIESGSFPLADGFPGRVGLLRGYGNAIVPQEAAEFIQAYYEARRSMKS
jgi:DNA (cytosine-5)-methyltransferase 1